MKAETCVRTIEELETVLDRKLASNIPAPDRCALITSQLYQSYGWYLQDLSDNVIAALTQEMNKLLHEESQYYADHKDQEAVSMFLKQQTGDEVVQQTQELMNQIQQMNAQKQAELAAEATANAQATVANTNAVANAVAA